MVKKLILIGMVVLFGGSWLGAEDQIGEQAPLYGRIKLLTKTFNTDTQKFNITSVGMPDVEWITPTLILEGWEGVQLMWESPIGNVQMSEAANAANTFFFRTEALLPVGSPAKTRVRLKFDETATHGDRFYPSGGARISLRSDSLIGKDGGVPFDYRTVQGGAENDPRLQMKGADIIEIFSRAPAGEISGQIVNSLGEGIPRIQIDVFVSRAHIPSRWQQTGTVLTDWDGSYRIYNDLTYANPPNPAQLRALSFDHIEGNNLRIIIRSPFIGVPDGVFETEAYEGMYWTDVNHSMDGERVPAPLRASGENTVPAKLLTAPRNLFRPDNGEEGQIKIELEGDSMVKIDIYDQRWKFVATILDGELRQGESVIGWKGTDVDGQRVGSGVYHVDIRVGGRAFKKSKFVVVR